MSFLGEAEPPRQISLCSSSSARRSCTSRDSRSKSTNIMQKAMASRMAAQNTLLAVRKDGQWERMPLPAAQAG